MAIDADRVCLYRDADAVGGMVKITRRRRRLWALKGWRTRRANLAKRRRRRVRRVDAITIVRRRRARAKAPTRRRGKHAANRRAGRLKSRARRASTISRARRKAADDAAARATPKTHVVTIPVAGLDADPLQVQVTCSFRLPAGMEPTAQLVKEAIAFRIANGYDAPGVTTAIVRWRNPKRLSPEDRTWREGDQAAAWETLGNALSAWASV